MKNTGIVLLLFSLAASLSCSRNTDRADGYGNFEATEITVSAEAHGKILFFNAEEGQVLGANDVVGVIDTLQLSLRRDQLEAMKNTVSSKSRNVLSQREVLLEKLKVAQNDQQRITNLIRDGAATQKQLDDINGQLEVLKQQIRSVETQNAPIINEVRGIEAQIRQLDDQIDKSVIRNPIAGTVLAKFTEPHEITAFGKPLYKIADLGTMELRVYISETQLASIAVGHQVTVKIDDGEGQKTYPGTIAWISDTAEFTPKIIQTREERVNLVYAVKVRVVNDGSLKIGMPGEMWIRDAGEDTNAQ